MGLLRDLFGPSREEIWRQFAERIGGRYVDGGFWRGDKVVAQVGQWTVTLDNHRIRSLMLDTQTVRFGNKSSHTYTRLRAPYVNADGLRFTIYRAHLFSPLAEAAGLQDIRIGDPLFDKAFVVKSNDEARVQALLANVRLRRLLRLQPDVHFCVKDDEGWFAGSFPKGVDELYFEAEGTIMDMDRLRQLYWLFAETLHTLCHIGSAYEDDPGTELT